MDFDDEENAPTARKELVERVATLERKIRYHRAAARDARTEAARDDETADSLGRLKEQFQAILDGLAASDPA